MEQKLSKEDLEIDIGEILSVLLSKLWLIIFLAVIGGLAMLMYSKFMIAPLYSSSTRVYVLNRQGANGESVTVADLQLSSQITKDYAELITSRTVMEQVDEELGLNMGASALKGMVSVSTASADTRIISISVQDTDAYRAQKIAQKVREVASVQICEVMNIEAVNVVDEAEVPTAPFSPNVRKNTIYGGVFGIVIAVALILLNYFLDDTIKGPDDVERYLQLSVLGSIPVLETGKKEKKRKARVEMRLEDEPVYRDTKNAEDTEDTEDSEEELVYHNIQNLEEESKFEEYDEYDEDNEDGYNEDDFFYEDDEY